MPYREKPRYNTKRRTAVPRVFSSQSTLAQPGSSILLAARPLSSSTPQLKPSRDADTESNASSTRSGSKEKLVRNQRTIYDSDSAHVDTVSTGKHPSDSDDTIRYETKTKKLKREKTVRKFRYP